MPPHPARFEEPGIRTECYFRQMHRSTEVDRGDRREAGKLRCFPLCTKMSALVQFFLNVPDRGEL
jgi:hypothetical protein